ncbi:site-specific DNA-methyltransferase [Clostridium sp.]|uniref:DNA-methyltransferase n=1 Tax=Clostridium sp. TaxID=1506 RepID=UPI0032164CD1
MSIVETLLTVFKGKEFTTKEAYNVNPDVNKESVRARIYEGIGTYFDRIGKGLYIAKDQDCLLIEGDGRDLSIIQDSSIDCIITDHPWSDGKSNKGGNRNFAEYNCFEYTVEDFRKKARVLKEGNFLVEVIPAENENNFDYLYKLKKMAQQAGFEYYAKVPWIKGTFVSNTGRKAKNTEELMIFSKGKPRALRIDAKKTKALGIECYMSGTNMMLPTDFNVQAVANNKKIVQSEKPSELFEQLLEYITKENEIVLDQFAGSGSVGQACINTNRRCILIEKARECIKKIANRLDCICLNNKEIKTC